MRRRGRAKGVWTVNSSCELGRNCPFSGLHDELGEPPSVSVGDSSTDDVEGSQIPDRSTIAAEAQSAVYGERGKDYGHPNQNFADVADLWSVLLGDRLTGPVTAQDVARCMIAVKLARDLHSEKRDNRVDGIGYFITLDRLSTGN